MSNPIQSINLEGTNVSQQKCDDLVKTRGVVVSVNLKVHAEQSRPSWTQRSFTKNGLNHTIYSATGRNRQREPQSTETSPSPAPAC